MTIHQPAELSPAVLTVAGNDYMPDAKGNLTPADLVKPQDKLQDQTVRVILGYATALSEQLARFKQHTFEDIGAFEATLRDEYELSLGGKKGNMTLTSYDGCYKVEVRVQDRIDFGPELQIAKGLIDECLTEWAADSRAEIRTIVTRAFNTDKPGQVNRSELFMLLRLDIEDPRWVRAMEALRDAMKVVGTATYVRCSWRTSPEADWQSVLLDLAKV